MGNNKIEKTLSQCIAEFRLPRYKELPEIDFYMDQVISLMEKCLYLLSGEENSKLITPAMINNYVKLGIIPPPIKKRYSREHICYLFIVCMLKSVMPISAISHIIAIQTNTHTIFELYDVFCEAYEKVLKKTDETSREMLEANSDAEANAAELALFMSIHASTAQLIAQNGIKSILPTKNPQDKEQKKEKGKQ